LARVCDGFAEVSDGLWLKLPSASVGHVNTEENDANAEETQDNTKDGDAHTAGGGEKPKELSASSVDGIGGTWYDDRTMNDGKQTSKEPTAHDQLFKDLLWAFFGELPEQVEAQIQAMETEAELDNLLKAVLTAQSLDDLGFKKRKKTASRRKV
jgi:hypothetical protein